MNVLRKTIVSLSLLLSLLSVLFYKYSGLYFYLDERSEISPVNALKSQGGDENYLIAAGFVLFLLLAVLLVLRHKRPLSMLDFAACILAMLFQGFALLMVEVGSFKLSAQAHNGWILVIWFLTYTGLWIATFSALVTRARSS